MGTSVTRTRLSSNNDAGAFASTSTVARSARRSLPMSDRSPTTSPSFARATTRSFASVTTTTPRSTTYIESPGSPTSKTTEPAANA